MKKILKLFVITSLVLVMSLGTINAQTNANVVVKNSGELVAAIESAGTNPTQITIAADIEINTRLEIKKDQNITFIDDGTARTIRYIEGMKGSSIEIRNLALIEEGGQLRITTSDIKNPKLLTFDGINTIDTYGPDFLGHAITVEGILIMDSGRITNNKIKAARKAAISVVGKNAKFIFNDGVIDNNIFYNQYGGAVAVYEDAYFEMNGGLITNNDSSPEKQINNGVVYIESKGNTKFVMNGGSITKNHALEGTVYIGSGNPQDFIVGLYAEMIMNGGSITDNVSDSFGGGITVMGQGKVTINDGLISGNEAEIGGGIAVYDLYVGFGDQYYDHDVWKPFFPAALTINGGTISNNVAKKIKESSERDGGIGGGIYVASDNVIINKANIINNHAESQGGGVYVGTVPYILHIYDALVTENSAEILGGGVWLCPTGDIVNTVTNGGAIFGNKVTGTKSAGDDIVAVPQTNKENFVTLADRVLGGGEIRWYRDGGVESTHPELGNVLGIADDSPRFESPSTSERLTKIKVNNEGLALKGIVNDAAAALAQSQAKVIIKGNTAKRGGGIGSNGGIHIGNPSEEWKLKVTKEWDDEINPEDYRNDDVEISLVIGDFKLDTIVLNDNNNWEYAFNELPNPATLGEAKISVIENGNTYDVSYSDLIIDEATKTLSIKVTNKNKAVGNLVVSKKVEGNDSDSTKQFDFTIKLDQPLTDKFGDLLFNEGVATFKLASGESINITNLPAGVKYEVVETETDYEMTVVNGTGIIEKDKTIQVSFTNSKNKTPEIPEEPEVPEVPEEPNKPELPGTGIQNNGGFMIVAIGGLLMIISLLNKKLRNG